MENEPIQDQNIQPEPAPIPDEGSSRGFGIPKFALAGLALFIVLLVAGGAYFLGSKNNSKPTPIPTPIAQKPTPTDDPTANWQNYQGDGYTVKFPSGWTTSNLYGSKSFVGFFPNSAKLNGNTYNSSTFNENTPYLSVVVMDSDPHSCKGECEILSNPKPTTVNGLSATEYSQLEGFIGNMCACNSMKILVSKGGKFYELALFGVGMTPEDQAPQAIPENYKNIFNQFVASFEFTNSSSKSTTQKYLDIPEYGVKIPLSESIKDAYYTTVQAGGNTYIFLKVHSLDSEPYCSQENTGLAALNRVGKNEINQQSGEKYSDSRSGVVIGDYFYFTDHEQAVCSQNSANIPIETAAAKAFVDTSKSISALQ